MIYITFNDTISGIYKSQVIDVVHKLNEISGKKVKLIAFFSLRNYLNQRKKIKELYSNSLAIPMVPKLSNWEFNKHLLKLINNKRSPIIARGVFAANLAQLARKNGQKVCYDGRGAITEEFKEYDVGSNNKLTKRVFALEKTAILNSDYRISVSKELVKYWQTTFDYDEQAHQVVPCSLASDFERMKDINPINRSDFGWSKDDIVLVFSGSVSAWQSFDLLAEILKRYLSSLPNIKVLFLSEENGQISKLCNEYQERVRQIWVEHKQVYSFLKIADYGILIREQSVTNKVASPVKFAEYLSAGLKVLISPNLGDYSKLVEELDLGYVFDGNRNPDLISVKDQDKERMAKIAKEVFSKNSPVIVARYKTVLQNLQ